jgi:hypothetical protein
MDGIFLINFNGIITCSEGDHDCLFSPNGHFDSHMRSRWYITTVLETAVLNPIIMNSKSIKAKDIIVRHFEAQDL